MGIYSTIAARDPKARQAEADALEAALRDMAASLSRDYVSGQMGTRHNTYQHRSRVLRQLTAQLATMRAEVAEPAS
jgi:hypothetical protein